MMMAKSKKDFYFPQRSLTQTEERLGILSLVGTSGESRGEERREMGGGGDILRAAGRAVGAGIGPGQIPTVKPKPTGFLSMPSSSVTLPVSVTSTGANNRSVSRFFDEENDWERIQEEEEVDDGIGVSGFSPRHVFGTVPSREEVETALSTIQQYTKTIENRFGSSTTMKDGADQMMNATNFARGVPSTNWQLNWTEPALHLNNPQSAQSQAYDHMFNAFHLLQINPSVQRMVTSLSSDKAVWDAVMNNEAVKELKESFYTAGRNQLESSKEESEAVTQLLRWILDNTKAKIAEIIDKIAKLMNDLFQPSQKERVTDIFMDTLRSSLMLSVMVLLVVVVTRVQRAWTSYRIPM